MRIAKTDDLVSLIIFTPLDLSPLKVYYILLLEVTNKLVYPLSEPVSFNYFRTQLH